MKDQILEEPKMAFVVSPRARYHHQIGSKFALKLLELAVRWLAKGSRQCDMGHLGLDRLGRYRIRHGDGVLLNWSMQAGKKGVVLDVPRTNAISPMMMVPKGPMYELVWVTVLNSD
jgi:hypothetical protein